MKTDYHQSRVRCNAQSQLPIHFLEVPLKRGSNSFQSSCCFFVWKQAQSMTLKGHALSLFPWSSLAWLIGEENIWQMSTIIVPPKKRVLFHQREIEPLSTLTQVIFRIASLLYLTTLCISAGQMWANTTRKDQFQVLNDIFPLSLPKILHWSYIVACNFTEYYNTDISFKGSLK